MDDNQIAAELRDLADEADTELAQHDLETLADALDDREYDADGLWCAPGGIDDSIHAEAEHIEVDGGTFADCVVLPYNVRDERTKYTGRRLSNYTDSEQIANTYNNLRGDKQVFITALGAVDDIANDLDGRSGLWAREGTDAAERIKDEYSWTRVSPDDTSGYVMDWDDIVDIVPAARPVE